MIGIMNVPCESPAEYYAAPKKEVNSITTVEKNVDKFSSVINNKASSSKNKLNIPIDESHMFLFEKKNKNKTIQYLADGRKIEIGQNNKKPNSPKLWEQLIMRTIVHKIEEEIPSPVDQIKNIATEFDNLNGHLKKDNPLSHSTYSLVSDDRVRSHCSKCRPFKFLCKRQLSKSSNSLISNDK
ncbi:Hypothetical protein SRAE_X000190200 [Strongyloides ratti]|uniref:Uncharacterized protein n=1 Tax=Strongyloides ratti TaxID=34506 RepID=A0A090MPU8_STRRB|nr:Hypothetical protein SRAE_X000190200 [Strongyloides ratti]CEF60162.1 Hypothetical protein SRAE_X000190200 [Strongyloides ratti]